MAARCLSRPRRIGLDEGVTTEIAETIGYVRESTERLLAALDALTDADVARPSLCPEWTVGHVLTHLARSADGIRGGLEGARRGEVVPMYESTESRNADIEAGANRSITELVADIAESSRLVAQAWSDMDDAAWDGTFLHRRLGNLPVRVTPAMRWYEVEIHRVDLAGDYGPADWSLPFLDHVLDESVHHVSQRLPEGVGIDLSATDTGARLSFGTGQRVVVSGPSWALAAWLLGRPVADVLSTQDGPLPELTAWA